MRAAKATLKSWLPPALLAWYRRRQIARQRRLDRGQSVKTIFTRIYADHVWGGQPDHYFSGQGSTPAAAAAYVERVRAFMQTHGIQSVVDLGCGDFAIGRQLQMDGVDYTGVDIVDGLITRNQRDYGGPQTHFVCRDLITDPLPPGELALVRQVLQHLSNAQISAILAQVRAYPYVLITEHYPAPGQIIAPNRDKAPGGDIRVNDGSAVYLDQPPFSLPGVQLWLEVAVEPVIQAGETLRTFLIENQPQ